MSELLALMHVKNKMPIFWCVVCGSFIEFDLVYTNGNWFCSSLLIYIDCLGGRNFPLLGSFGWSKN